MKKNNITFDSFAKSLSIALMLAILLNIAAPVASAARTWNPPSGSVPFRDVPHNAWFFNDVAWAHANGIAAGFADGTFRPTANITRAEFATLLFRIAGNPSDSYTNTFRDVPNGAWFARSVSWASSTGVVSGTSPTTFHPNRHITREELVTMSLRYVRNIRNTHISAPASALDQFIDGRQVSGWALEPVQWAAYYGVLGRDGRLNARGNATRAEAVAILQRVAGDFLTDGNTPEHRPPPPPPRMNPLTGLPVSDAVSRNRPVAVSLGNTRTAMPTNATNGISQADIVYEMLVEWGETRLLALFQDFSGANLVGSIRSIRPYTVHFAEAHDAILVHAGGSQPGMDELRARGFTSFNEVHGPGRSVFSRNRNRIPGHTVEQYHSAVTSGSALTAGFSRYGTRTTSASSFVSPFAFTNNPIPSGGSRAHNVTVRFSAQKSSSFTFDQQQTLYTMSQRGSVFRDANNGAPVTFTNLFILRVPTTYSNLYHGDRRLDMNTIGNGTGFFVSNGRVVDINWTRANLSSQFVFTLSNGGPVELGRGRTYIGIIPTDRPNVSITFG